MISKLTSILLLTLIIANQAKAQSQLPDHVIERFGEPPVSPTTPLAPNIDAAIQIAFIDSIANSTWGAEQNVALDLITNSGDPRLVWHIADLQRFISRSSLNTSLTVAASTLLEKELPSINAWGHVTDHLIAWDIPEPPNYLPIKRAMFTSVEPRWADLFTDGDIDWRHVSWGGVLIDDRPFGTTDDPCNCIPAADDPEVSSAADATWLEDDDIVFGIVVNGLARAYPRQIMEVREMVNDTLGGRDLGIPYCTLCGAAQAYFTDELPAGVARPILRTSGLLIRSNKVMYDLTTFSVLDTFKGTAITGPLAEQGIILEQASVVTTRWGRWKEAHPDTTVLVESLALGRDFDFRNNRDANGPIFPVGDIDPRLPVHEDVIGILTQAGEAHAFQRSTALVALQNGEDLTFDGGRLVLDAGGIKAVDTIGTDMGSHQAFWFAWSQFHPETKLWQGGDQ